ncbi:MULTISPECIES: hypothetical protein [unclassified Bradyrhizobium]
MPRATIARSFTRIFSIRLALWLGFPHRLTFAGLHRENVDGAEIDRILVTVPRSTFEKIHDDVVARQYVARPAVKPFAREPKVNPWIALFEIEISAIRAVEAERLPKLLALLPLAFERYRESPALPQPLRAAGGRKQDRHLHGSILEALVESRHREHRVRQHL